MNEYEYEYGYEKQGLSARERREAKDAEAYTAEDFYDINEDD